MNQLVDDFLSSPFIFSFLLIIVLVIIILIVYEDKEKMWVNVGKICVYTYISYLGLMFTRDHFNLQAQKKLMTNNNVSNFTGDHFVEDRVSFPIME